MAETTALFAGVLPFFHTAQERSFRRAAERLGVTSAAVSKAVLRLEDSLGVKLLARTSRTVNLTPEGAAFLERCREAIGSLEAGREQLTASRRLPRGELHVTMSFVLGGVIVPSFGALTARYPELSLRVTMTDRLLSLVDERVDVAVRIGAPTDSSLLGRRLRSTRWVTVASPVFVARHGAPTHPRELARYNCLHFLAPNGRPREWAFRDPGTGALSHAEVRGSLVINHGDHLLTAALAGIGLCQVLDFMVDDHLREGRLVEVLAPWAGEGPPVYCLCVPERRRSPNVAAFLTFLDGVFGAREPAP